MCGLKCSWNSEGRHSVHMMASVTWCNTPHASYSRIQRECPQVSAKHLSVHSQPHVHTKLWTARTQAGPSASEYPGVERWNLFF